VYRFLPSFLDQKAAGANVAGETTAWPFPDGARCEPEIPVTELSIMSYVFNSAYANLELWMRKGTPPPHAARMEVRDASTSQASIVTDQYGNGLGGVRSPYVDVPVATYRTNSQGPLGTCRQMGYKEQFDWARLDALYGNYKNYAAKVTQSVDRLVKERFFTESDGRRIKAELIAPPPASPRSSQSSPRSSQS
jgi:hypothetical protein